MAPHVTGTVFGVANTLSSSFGFLAPQIVGFLLDEDVSILHVLINLSVISISYIISYII